MTTTEETLTERGKRYGEFKGHAEITWRLKSAMQSHSKWLLLADDQKEALDMIAHKIGRVLNGDPNYEDSWRDMSGYPALVANRLLKEQSVNILRPHVGIPEAFDINGDSSSKRIHEIDGPAGSYAVFHDGLAATRFIYKKISCTSKSHEKIEKHRQALLEEIRALLPDEATIIWRKRFEITQWEEPLYYHPSDQLTWNLYGRFATSPPISQAFWLRHEVKEGAPTISLD